MLRNSWFGLLALAILAAGIAVWASASNSAGREKLGLFSTLPIYWGEVGGMEDMLSGAADPHWVRDALEGEYSLVPLDALLETGDDDGAMNKFDLLVMAQPRALSASENVALDNWVRAGGRVLIFADPMLTRHSRFSIGDRRRSQDVVLLSPILRRWGLELQVDGDDELGERLVEFGQTALPVNLAGTFVPHLSADSTLSECRFIAGGLLVDCAIGEGRALIVADAAVLEDHVGEDDPVRREALRMLTGRAFDSR